MNLAQHLKIMGTTGLSLPVPPTVRILISMPIKQWYHSGSEICQGSAAERTNFVFVVWENGMKLVCWWGK